MEATASPIRPTSGPDKRTGDRLDKVHQATADAKHMAKLVAQYFESKADEHRRQPKEVGRHSDNAAMDDSGMWGISQLVELTARADKAVEDAMR